MKNDYRMVYNETHDIMYIQPRRQNLFQAQLNGEAARLLMAIDKHADDPDYLEKAYEDNRDFLEQCFARGWVDENLHLNSPVKTSVGKHHLKSLQIEMLLKCNLGCGYCYCSAGNKRPEILSKEEIVTLLDDAERLGVLSVDFTGGEFFLHPNWKEFLSHSKQLGLAISIHTNGMALTQKNVEFIADIGVHRIQITADGADAESHNAIRGNKNAFQLMEAGIKRLQEHDIKPRVNIMVHKHTKDSLADIIKYFQDTGNSINFDWIAPFGSEKNKNIGITAAEYFEAVAPLRKNVEALKLPNACGRDMGWGIEDYEPDCGVGQSYLFVTATGEIAICPVLTSKEDKTLFDGPNIKEYPLYDAWLNHSYFDKHRFVNCENVATCPAGTTCKGGCRANAFAQAAGKLTAPNVIECNIRKNSTDKFVDFASRYKERNFELV